MVVHRELVPGHLEIVHGVTPARGLSGLGLAVERHVPVATHHKRISFEEGFRADLLAEAKVLLELNPVERVPPAHKKRVQT